MNQPRFLLTFLLLPAVSAASLSAQTKIESYRYSEYVPSSSKYSVTVNGVEVKVLTTEEPDICIFGCDGPVDVKISCLGDFVPDSVAVRPQAKGYDWSLKGNEISVKLNTGDRISVEPNYSEEKPLFIFVNPLEAEAVAKAKKDRNTIFFGAGEIHKADGVNITEKGQLLLENGVRVYIQGGAIVEGFINHREYSKGITLEGCGILDARYMGMNAIRMHHAKGLRINNLTTISRDRWINLLFDCNNMEINNYHIVGVRTTTNRNGNENDGIDFVGCSHVNIRHCFSYTHDDAYCIKTGAFDLIGKATDIHHEDLVAWNITSGNNCEIGYACGQEVSDIWYKDIYCIHSGSRPDRFRRSAISVHQGRGADVHDIHYENIYVEDPTEHIFSIHAFESPYKSDREDWHPGHIYNVTVKNLRAWKDAPCGSVITGAVETVPVENVTFTDCYIGDRKITSFETGDVRNHKFCKNVIFE